MCSPLYKAVHRTATIQQDLWTILKNNEENRLIREIIENARYGCVHYWYATEEEIKFLDECGFQYIHRNDKNHIFIYWVPLETLLEYINDY